MKGGRSTSSTWLYGVLLAAGVSLGGCSDDSETVAVTGTDTPTGDESTVSSGPDMSLFSAEALTSSNIVDCELSDGTATQCYELVTTGLEKVDDMIGPFCPDTITAASDEAGVWLDGTSLYQADGDFILNLPNLYGQTYPPAENWIFSNDDGSVNVTTTLEACVAAARPDVDPAYYGYCVQCDLDLIEDDMSLTFLIPVTPEAADAPGNLTASAGVSLNGFQIAAAAPVEAILSAYTIAAFDDCGGHVNPNDGYHYHAATGANGCNSAGSEDDGHPSILGYAMDGYPIHGSLEAGSEEANLLDECFGNEDEVRGYHYHAASAEQNQHIACFHGKTAASEEQVPGGGPPAGGLPGEAPAEAG